MTARRLRVAQWATGNIGLRSLRSVIEHPMLELVGLHVYSESKAGRDAGDLCGLPATGVVATRDIEAIVAAAPDCVLYMPARLEPDDLVRLLEAGIDVVATRSELHRPASMEPALRDRLEAACDRGGATLHATGSSPGFITEALPLVLTSLQRELRCYTIDEFADMSSRDSPEMIFELMGFGRDAAAFDPAGLAHHGAASFGPSLRATAEALGIEIDDVAATAAVAVARETTRVAAGTVEAGTIAGQRFEVTALSSGSPRLRFRATWYLTRALDADWELGDTGWRVHVDGDAPLDVRIAFAVREDQDYAATTPGYTAHRAVNCVERVVAAPPGIRTTAELPQPIARLA